MGALIAVVLLMNWQGAQLQSCQVQLLVFRQISGADGSVFCIRDGWCTCIFVAITQELEIYFLGCGNCICSAFFLPLPMSRPLRGGKEKKILIYICLQAFTLSYTIFRNL